jgi:hypothetical protein
VITVSILGGLGNQMFQYAAAKALACRHGVELAVDESSFRTYALRPFMLDRLQIPELDASVGKHSLNEPMRAKNFAIMQWRNRADRFLARLGLAQLAKAHGTYSEPHLHFDPDFFALGSTVSLYGYFQSERYFGDIAGQLRGYFRPREPLGLQAQAVADMIARADMPVSIHVRRGDYVKSAETARVHGSLGAAYYRKALKVLQGTIDTPITAFVFSDDAAAAETVLDFASRENLVHVRGDPDRSWEDMALMALCRHHIIANSSFSWWGAWLDASPDKVVIAPREWFTPAELRRRNTCDLYPPDWILL